MKRFLPWVVLIVALLIVASVVRQCRNAVAENYQISIVTRGPITQAVTATGTLNPVVNVQVGSQVSGNIAKLFADFNSEVKAGQTVAQIDPMLFQAAVTQAEGDLASTQAALELAKANAKIKQGALDKAKADLDHCTITSPIDGVVISRSVDVGQTVAASLQAPVIFAIANDLTKMQIDSNVAEADVGVVKIDQNVDFTVDAFPMQTFHGKVVQVRNAPITVQNVVTYDTVIGVSNQDLKLKPGMTANVSIVVAHRDDVLQIKNAALRYRPPDATPAEIRSTSPPSGDQDRNEAQASDLARPPGKLSQRPSGGRERRADRTVYLLNGNHAKPVQIRTGISDGIVTEVIEGLKEGNQVITAELTSTSATSPPPNLFSGGPRRFP